MRGHRLHHALVGLRCVEPSTLIAAHCLHRVWRTVTAAGSQRPSPSDTGPDVRLLLTAPLRERQGPPSERRRFVLPQGWTLPGGSRSRARVGGRPPRLVPEPCAHGSDTTSTGPQAVRAWVGRQFDWSGSRARMGREAVDWSGSRARTGRGAVRLVPKPCAHASARITMRSSVPTRRLMNAAVSPPTWPGHPSTHRTPPSP